MKYDIHITRAAEKDLNSAADYIEFVLLNPQAADDLLVFFTGSGTGSPS